MQSPGPRNSSSQSSVATPYALVEVKKIELCRNL
jgi:hypothetical protein